MTISLGWLLTSIFVSSGITMLVCGVFMWRSRCRAVMDGGFHHAGRWWSVTPEPEGYRDTEVFLGGDCLHSPQAWRGPVGHF